LIGRDAELASLGKLLADILQQTLEVKLLVTSRECLNLHEEWLYESQGLAFPRTPNQDISSYSAGTLFIQSARRARVNYTFTEDDAPAVAQICHLLEGNPLGIELAASWMLLLSCHEIAQEMKCNLDFLAAPIHGVPNRHLSMRAVFDHSWNLLSELERSVLHQLSVFHGGFQRGAAEQVTGADLLTLSALVDKSLIRRTP
jgi:predicted ATPase